MSRVVPCVPGSSGERQYVMKQAQKRNILVDREGIGLVGAMLALALLGVLALVAAQLASNEKQTSWNEWVHAGSFHAADSGGEAAIGWLLEVPGAPPIPNFGTNMQVSYKGETSLHGSQTYTYRMDFLRLAHRPGSGTTFPEFYYDVDSSGGAGSDGNSNIELMISKQVPLGY